MMIEIHSPELEALIMQRMRSGGFHNVEDVLMQALETSPLPEAKPPQKRTGADLIAAMQASPYREIEIEPARYRMPVRDVAF
ncbi:MAG: hypothetical protein ACKV2U_02410 [Bryobacteraceae bacterium]